MLADGAAHAVVCAADGAAAAVAHEQERRQMQRGDWADAWAEAAAEVAAAMVGEVSAAADEVHRRGVAKPTSAEVSPSPPPANSIPCVSQLLFV